MFNYFRRFMPNVGTFHVQQQQLEHFRHIVRTCDAKEIIDALDVLIKDGINFNGTQFDYLFEYLYHPPRINFTVILILLNMGHPVYPRSADRIQEILDGFPGYSGETLTESDRRALREIIILYAGKRRLRIYPGRDCQMS